MDRIKAEYLQKILEQVNIQNVEYFQNLACEYTLQLQLLESGTIQPKSQSNEENLDSKEDIQPQEENLAYINFMKKPDIIQMHLDILYKQVTFITPSKIASILPNFKQDKMQK